jgi:hypothetical protein
MLPKCFLDQLLARRCEAYHPVSPIGRMRVAPEQVPPYQAIAGDTHRTSGQTNPERDFRNRLWTFVPKGLERREIGEAEAKLIMLCSAWRANARWAFIRISRTRTPLVSGKIGSGGVPREPIGVLLLEGIRVLHFACLDSNNNGEKRGS